MSRAQQVHEAPDVRMNVKVSRRDFPLLTEEIARLPKGPRRTNRLVHLATLGLCWERAIAGNAAASPDLLLHGGTRGTTSGPPLQPYRCRLDAGQLAALLDEDRQ